MCRLTVGLLPPGITASSSRRYVKLSGSVTIVGTCKKRDVTPVDQSRGVQPGRRFIRGPFAENDFMGANYVNLKGIPDAHLKYAILLLHVDDLRHALHLCGTRKMKSTIQYHPRHLPFIFPTWVLSRCRATSFSTERNRKRSAAP